MKKVVACHWPLHIWKASHPGEALPGKKKRTVLDGEEGIEKLPDYKFPQPPGVSQIYDYVDISAERRKKVKDELDSKKGELEFRLSLDLVSVRFGFSFGSLRI